MPRKHDPTGGPGGRLPTDDGPLARGVLFAHRIMRHSERDMVGMAATLLMQARAVDAARAEAAGDRKAVIGRDSARRRIREVVAAELAEQGDNKLTGLPADLRRAGRRLAALARRDGYGAARAALVAAIAHNMAWGGTVTDAEIRRECAMVADAWVRRIEADLPPP